jgi:hypothetical protein
MYANLHAREPGDPITALPPVAGCGPLGEGQGRTPEMYGCGKSDSPVVPAKPSNNAASAVAEVVEERGLGEGNMARGHRVPDTEPGQARHVRWVVCVRAGFVSDVMFDPRQEPSAVVPHAGICAGGRPAG